MELPAKIMDVRASACKLKHQKGYLAFRAFLPGFSPAGFVLACGALSFFFASFRFVLARFGLGFGASSDLVKNFFSRLSCATQMRRSPTCATHQLLRLDAAASSPGGGVFGIDLAATTLLLSIRVAHKGGVSNGLLAVLLEP